MAHGTSSRFPHMLLWIEIGCCDWEVDDLKARMRLKHFTDGWARVPGGTIPEKDDRNIRVAIEYLL
jgi:hypothetical protein